MTTGRINQVLAEKGLDVCLNIRGPWTSPGTVILGHKSIPLSFFNKSQKKNHRLSSNNFSVVATEPSAAFARGQRSIASRLRGPPKRF